MKKSLLSLVAIAAFNSTTALAATIHATPPCSMPQFVDTSMTQNPQISIALAESACLTQLNTHTPATWPALADWVQECEGLPGGTWGCGVSAGPVEYSGANGNDASGYTAFCSQTLTCAPNIVN